MIEHFFVIKYSNESGWEWDTEVEGAHFSDGTTYDTKEDTWLPSWQGEEEGYVDDDDEVGEKLGYMLKVMNYALQPADSKLTV
jgi:hypothetical protein